MLRACGLIRQTLKWGGMVTGVIPEDKWAVEKTAPGDKNRYPTPYLIGEVLGRGESVVLQP